MDASRAHVFQPLVKGNEALETRLMDAQKEVQGKPRLHVSAGLLFGVWPLRCAPPRAILLAMITMRKSTNNSWVSFSFPYEYGIPPGGPSCLLIHVQKQTLQLLFASSYQIIKWQPIGKVAHLTSVIP